MTKNKLKLMKSLVNQYKTGSGTKLRKLSYINASDLQTIQLDGISYYQIPSNLPKSVDIYIMVQNRIIVPWKYLKTRSMKDGDYSLYVPANGKQFIRIFPNNSILYARQNRD